MPSPSGDEPARERKPVGPGARGPQDDRGGIRDYARYSGIAFQMIATLLVATFGGQWLDERFGTSPLYTTICVLVGLGLALWLPLRSLLKK